MNMTQKLTILFDLDGTLVDTAPDLMSAHNHVMKKFGFQQSKLEDIKRLAGRGTWIMMQRSFREKITDEKIKKEMIKEFIDFTVLSSRWCIAPFKKIKFGLNAIIFFSSFFPFRISSLTSLIFKFILETLK